MQAEPKGDLFESLFTREYKGIVSAASRIVGTGLAEDIAQEAFSALYRARPTDEAHARHWLYRTTLHRALDHLRASRRRQAYEAASDAAEDTEDPTEAAERSQARAAVSATLRRLPRRYAGVLALRHSGFSYKEIAEIIDVHVNQVGTLLVRAEAMFKKEFDRATSLH